MRNWTAPKSIAQFISWEAFQIWVLPLFSVPVTVVIGWLSDFPWFYIWLGVGFMFAMVTTGLLRFNEWRTRTTSEDKLTVSSVRIHKILSSRGEVSSVGIGFQLQNRATFPMQFSVQNMTTQLMGKYPENRPYTNDTITVPPGNIGWFCDNFIDISGVSKTGELGEGKISARLEYGRPGDLRHTLGLNKKAFAAFDERGDVQFVEWEGDM